MQTPLHIGADVAKDTIVAACAEGAWSPQTLRNDLGALRAWLKTLPPGSRLGLEATGGYHEALADLAHAQGLIVYVLNPKDVHYYARGLGRRAKTDRVDAELIARYIAKEQAELHAYTPPSAGQRSLSRLQHRRACVVRLKVALEATARDLGECRREFQTALRRLQRLIQALDLRIEQRLQEVPELHQTQQRLQTIVGVGPVVSGGLAPVLCRLLFRNADAFVAYTGLDPRPCDSGQKTGRRRLSKRGPGELRRLLYTAAMAAIGNPAWQAIYQRYRLRGLSGTAALVIIARKISRIAWSLHHHQTTFDPAHLKMA